MAMTTNDIEYTNHGTIVTMMPLTEAARDWVWDNVDCSMTFGEAVCIEPRFFPEIAYGAQEDGLTSNVRVEPR
jgi:hypothetical protein